MVCGTFSFCLDKKSQSKEVGAFPGSKRSKELETEAVGLHYNLHLATIFRRRNVTGIVHIETLRRKFETCGLFQLHVLSFFIPDGIGEWIECNRASHRQCSHDFRGSYEGVRAGKAVVTLREISIE